MRAVVITPPYFLLTGPVAAPSVLTSVLRETGHDAINFDVNRFCIAHLLSGPAVIQAITKALPRIESPELRSYVAKVLPVSLPKSIQALQQGPAFQSFDTYRRAQLDVEVALHAHALGYGDSRWSSIEYVGDHDRTNPEDLICAVRSGGEVFDEPIEEAANLIAEFAPDLAALSVSVPSQLYGALRLARCIHLRRPETHVCLGGATITRLRQAIAKVPPIFDLVDSVVLREGESPLVALAECLQNGRDPFEFVPDLLLRRDTTVLMSTGIARPNPGGQLSAKSFNLRDLPSPVFDDLIPGTYLAPQLVLPVSTTRNCYYDKCDFCAISRSFGRGYREMSQSQMVRQLSRLAEHHPGALFKDVSEALSPRLVFGLCEVLERSDERFAWEAYFRFESPFNDRVAARRLRTAGLRVAYLGLETASQRLSNEMAKNINVDSSERTIRHFAEEGIWVHLFLMAGHPNETEADHEATIAFVRRNAPYIHSIQAAGFQMELDSNIIQLSNRFGFSARPPRQQSFSLTLDLEERGSIPPDDTIRRRVSELRQVVAESATLLAKARQVWDGHKIIFSERDGSSLVALGWQDTERFAVPQFERCFS